MFFFFKQKTAYELRISDWSSDVCSSDLVPAFAEAVQDGLSSWVEAGFAAPVRYNDGKEPHVDRYSIDDIVTGALIATRPDPDGRRSEERRVGVGQYV